MSSDRDALLAAVCATPEDDTPRLVFADWLQEHGSPEWAALIRAECELARLADDGSGAEAVFRFLADRDQKALKGVKWAAVDAEIARRVQLATSAERLRRKAWRQMSAVMPTGCGVTWDPFATRRGFPCWVRVTDHDRAVACVPRLLKTSPPATLWLAHSGAFTEGSTRRLVAAGLLRWVEGLRSWPPSLRLVAEASHSQDATRIRVLSHNTAEVVPSVIAGDWCGLRELILGDSEPLLRADAVRLFRSPHLRNLRTLVVHGHEWTRYTVRELNGFTELRELHLIGCGLGDDAAGLLANLPGLRNLRSLTLRGNRITGRGATALLTSAHLADLAFLDLEENPVRGLSARALAAATPGGLRGAQFHRCHLSVNDVAALAASPRLANLVYLDLDYNGLAESAVARLARGLGERGPAILYLMGNHFGATAAAALAGWRGAQSIHMLHLWENPLDTPAAKALAASPHLTAIRHLCTTNIPTAGLNVLRKRFGKKVEG